MWANPGHFTANVQVYGRHDRVVYFVCSNTDICIRAQWLAVLRE